MMEKKNYGNSNNTKKATSADDGTSSHGVSLTMICSGNGLKQEVGSKEKFKKKNHNAGAWRNGHAMPNILLVVYGFSNRVFFFFVFCFFHSFSSLSTYDYR